MKKSARDQRAAYSVIGVESAAKLLLVVLAAASVLACQGEARAPAKLTRAAPPARLTAGTAVSARLVAGAAQEYDVAVPAGHLLHLVVDQQGVDVLVALRRPGEPPRLVVDSPNRAWGPEELWWIAPANGLWRLEVRPLAARAEGRYTLRVLSLGPPDQEDRLRAAALAAALRADQLVAGDARAAQRELATALTLWRRGREPRQEALTELRRAEARVAAGEDATPSYRRSLAEFRRLGDHRQEVYVGLRLGEALRRAGVLGEARRAQQATLALARRSRLPEDEAAALNNLGLIREAHGDLRGALEHYQEALVIFRRLGTRDSMAASLHNLGAASSLLGSLDAAKQALAEALALRRTLGDVQGEAATLTELGWVYRLRGLTGGGSVARKRARALLEQALALRRAAGDQAGEAGTLDRLGTVLREEGRLEEALACYQRSLALIHPTRPGRDLAHSLTNLAELWLDRGEPRRARALAARAVSLFAGLPTRDPQGEVHARLLLGRAHSRLGAAAPAQREIERALEMSEELRAQLGDEALTLPFFALRQLYFNGAIDALMDLEARRPGQGFAAAAFLVSERARMRTLIDGIAERERRKRGLSNPQATSTLTVGEIESELLDEETLLLEISLGEERGFLWIVGRGGISVHPLPGRRILAPLVRKVHTGFARSRPDLAACRRLARLLLGPLADRPGIRRLVLVADGLAYVPFAALPWGPEGRPLVERFELVRIPSAATLLALRRRQAAERPETARGPTDPAVAVIADPVFSAYDPRVYQTVRLAAAAPPQDRNDLTRAVRDLRLDGLPRLPATRSEATAIETLEPGSFVALDFAASREVFARAAVQHATLLHLATHSLAHPVDPALSGIVLSLVDADGRPRPGFLRAAEIAGLDLRSHLVVLSACKTALGPEVRGEGLLGLSRAFLHAGASEVVASLWSVDDAASAALMTRFYEGLLRDRLPPAAALRQAQLAMRADPRTADAADWAGFELQGDWR